MKSTSGQHFIALDHVRALAAFMVFAWHFTHTGNTFPVPLETTPAIFPFALLDEGHTGVALFMTLSGYLFAKLLDGRVVRYRTFLWNRALRLLPLLVLVMIAGGFKRVFEGKDTVAEYLLRMLQGPILPTLPFGAWSITVEAHFYLLLPALLWMFRRSRALPLVVVAAAIALRIGIWYFHGEVQQAAYWTMIGRIDQFVLGMVFFNLRRTMAGRHLAALAAFVLICAVYWWFDQAGGFYRMPVYPSPSPFWIVLPTIEGACYAALIAWYDNSFSPANTGISRVIGRVGVYSYSIYLLHLFVVFDISRYIHAHVMDISNLYLACAWALAVFALFVPIAQISFRYIESPFLVRRQHYIVDTSEIDFPSDSGDGVVAAAKEP